MTIVPGNQTNWVTLAPGYSDFRYSDNQALLDHWINIDAHETFLRKCREDIEFELQQRMEAEGIKVLPHESLTCELKTASPDYEWGKLRAIAEHVPPEEFAKGFTPAHEETRMVPDRWNMTKIKPLIKYGTIVAEIIESATISKRAKLKIERKGIEVH